MDRDAGAQLDGAGKRNRLDVVLPDRDVRDSDLRAPFARAGVDGADLFRLHFYSDALQLQRERDVELDLARDRTHLNLDVRVQLHLDGMLRQRYDHRLARLALLRGI